MEYLSARVNESVSTAVPRLMFGPSESRLGKIIARAARRFKEFMLACRKTHLMIPIIWPLTLAHLITLFQPIDLSVAVAVLFGKWH